MASDNWPFDPDHEGINEIARSPEMRAALAAVAMKARGIAVGLSESFRETGEYIDSFEIESDTIEWVGEYPGRRGAAILKNTSDHAAAVEFGNQRIGAGHHVLARTLAGLDV